MIRFEKWVIKCIRSEQEQLRASVGIVNFSETQNALSFGFLNGFAEIFICRTQEVFYWRADRITR